MLSSSLAGLIYMEKSPFATSWLGRRTCKKAITISLSDRAKTWTMIICCISSIHDWEQPWLVYSTAPRETNLNSPVSSQCSRIQRYSDHRAAPNSAFFRRSFSPMWNQSRTSPAKGSPNSSKLSNQISDFSLLKNLLRRKECFQELEHKRKKERMFSMQFPMPSWWEWTKERRYFLSKARGTSSSHLRCLMWIMFHILEISLDASSQLMSMQDLPDWWGTTQFIFVAQMSMGLLLRQRQSKKDYHAKQYATNTIKFTNAFTSGSTLILTSLGEHQLQCKPRLRRASSKLSKQKEKHWKKRSNNNIVTAVSTSWLIGSSLELAQCASIPMQKEISAMDVENWSMQSSWSIQDVDSIQSALQLLFRKHQSTFSSIWPKFNRIFKSGSRSNAKTETGAITLHSSQTICWRKVSMNDASPEIWNGELQCLILNTLIRSSTSGSMHQSAIFQSQATILAPTTMIGSNGGRTRRKLSCISSWAKITPHSTQSFFHRLWLVRIKVGLCWRRFQPPSGWITKLMK